MRIPRLMPCAVAAALLAASAVGAPAHAQLGGLIKRRVTQKIAQAVNGVDSAKTAVADTSASGAAGKGARTAPQGPGPRFTEHLLEITPAVLDQLEKGLAAEDVVRQQIDRTIGKVLSHDDYRKCQMAVLSGPDGQKVYQQARDLATGDTSYQAIQKASLELARRMEQVVEPKCGLAPRKAEEIRSQNHNRLDAAAPAASGLTRVQLTLLKERILPLCAATTALAAVAGEVRVSIGAAASANPVYLVYTPNEVSALQARCGKLASALNASL